MDLIRNNSSPPPGAPQFGSGVSGGLLSAAIAGLVSALVYEAFRSDTPIVVNPQFSIEVPNESN